MSADRWERAKAIFEKALDRDDDERRAYVDGACGDDETLRSEVNGLLHGHDEAGDFLASPTQEELPFAAPAPTGVDGEGVGDLIGRYKLLQRIGEGGFGVVYMAEQTEPVRRKVALKVIKLGMDTKQVIARFEAERQALALMDHPHIARVLDAGATDTGRPYFVMELVRGIPITEYCDQNLLTTEQRLALFSQVCHAVQHAHQKGVIHRDIKPSNVLVTLHDGTPVPKVIDFGIAKATNQRLTEKTLFTEFRQLIGTPEYMSPEQAEMSGLDIDTRSDIYSLGVLLYELLAGSTPFDGRTLRSAAFAELQRIIREEEPQRPSTRVGDTTRGDRDRTSVEDVARQRRTEPPALARSLKGDLDWIVMRCLEKDRTRRYGSAGGLAEDIGRHIQHEPVLAGPPSAAYQFSKFARRHRAALVTAAVLAVAATIAVAAIIVALVVTVRTERELADALAQSKQNLEIAETNYQLARDAVDEYYVTVSDELLLDEPGMEGLRRELLGSAEVFYTRFVEEHADDPEVQGELAHTLRRLSAINAVTDARPEAKKLLERAETQYASLLRTQPDEPDFAHGLASCRLDRARLLVDGGDTEAATAVVLESIEGLRDLADEHPDDPEHLAQLATAHLVLGKIHYRTGDLEAAAMSWGAGLEANRTLAERYPDDPEHRDALARSHNAMGAIAYREGRLDEAAASYDEALVLLSALVAAYPQSQDYRTTLGQQHYNLAMLASRRGDWEAAAEQHEIAIRMRRELSEGYPLFVSYRHKLALTYKSLGVLHLRREDRPAALEAQEEAAMLLERVVEEHASVPEYLGDLARVYQNIGVTYEGLGDRERQGSSYASAIEIAERLIEAHPEVVDYRRDLAGYLNSYARAIDDDGDTQGADDAYRRGIVIWEQLMLEVPGDTGYPFYLAQALMNLGNLHRRFGAMADSLLQMNRAIDTIETLRERVPDDLEAQRLLAKLYRNRAKTLERLGRYEESLADWGRCVETTPGSTAVLWTVWRGTALVHLGRTDEAIAHAEQVVVDTTDPKQIGYVLHAAAVVHAVAAAMTDDTERHAARAVELLGDAADAGFFELPGHMVDLRREVRFDVLLEREDFRALVGRLET